MKELLHHFFIPRTTNNYRAKILHHRVLLSLILFFFSAGLLMSYGRSNFPSVLGTFSDISSQELLLLTNSKRQESSLNALTLNDSLSQAAANKASDMFAKDYWAHVAPDGTTPWIFIKGAGYNYIYAGENLARGFTNANDVINAWMASPEHKKNMLSSSYQNVGFAVSTGKLGGEDTVLVVEMLGSTSYAPAPVATQEQAKPVEVAVVTGAPAVVNDKQQEVPAEEAPIREIALNNNTLGIEKIITQAPQKIQDSIPGIKPLINSQALSFISARLILSLLIFAFILDMVILERKKILRFVGHNLDHVFFLSMILIVVVILAKGAII